jgi:hypothetical protein
MQTLQYHWHHVREKIKPQGEGGAAATTVASGRGDTERRTGPGGRKPEMAEGAMGMGTGASPRMPGMGGQRAAMGGKPGSMPMVGPGPMGAGMMGPGKLISQKEDEEEADMNLVELAVYGLASIYENPQKPASAVVDANAPK